MCWTTLWYCCIDYLLYPKENLVRLLIVTLTSMLIFFFNIRMKFPTVLVFYTTISHLIAGYYYSVLNICYRVLFAGVVVLISFMDRPGLFCKPGSIDLVESLKYPTHFCKLTGI